MSRSPLISSVLVLGLLCPHILPSAETGDFDGDGQITIADVVTIQESALDPGGFAPGSFDAFAAYPFHCSLSWDQSEVSVALEALRRSAPGSLPAFSWMHFDAGWGRAALPTSLPAAEEVSVRVADSVAGRDGAVDVEMEIETATGIRAFFILLESEGNVLRDRPLGLEGRDFLSAEWLGDASEFYRAVHGLGDIAVRVPLVAQLVTGGRYVVTYGLGMTAPPFGPGPFRIVTSARLPSGTPVGLYPVKAHEGSQFLLEDGRVVAPGATSEGRLVVSEDVTEGREEPLPPLRLDGENRRVLGKIEFRLADRDGNPAGEGLPLAEALPGEKAVLRVQARSEVPLNFLYFNLVLPQYKFQFDEWPEPMLRDPESGDLLLRCGATWEPNTGGYMKAQFHWGVNWSNRIDCESGNYPTHPLEYFRPLGEWVDLYEVTLTVRESTEAGDFPLDFSRHDPADPHARPVAEFAPYRLEHYGCGKGKPEEEAQLGRSWWTYDVDYHAGFIRVLGDNPPPPPPDFGIQFKIGSASGFPGDLVELPVFAASTEALVRLCLALEVDPRSLSVEAVDSRVLSVRTGDFIRQVVPRGGEAVLEECGPGEHCTFGVPYATHFFSSEQRLALLEWGDAGAAGEDVPYPGSSLAEIAKLRVRIAQEPVASEAWLLPAKADQLIEGTDTKFESGGFSRLDPSLPFSPASDVSPGVVHILGLRFLRGDSNGDGTVNLSDAVSVLGYLFLGSKEPPCFDAADADDTGRVEITDAIFLLGALFLGQGKIPSPYPECGPDETDDELSCKESVCRKA